MTAAVSTRRGVLAAAAGVATGSLAIRANASPVQQGDDVMNMHTAIAAFARNEAEASRPVWNRAIVAYWRAVDTTERYHRERYEPAEREFDRQLPNLGFSRAHSQILEPVELQHGEYLSAQAAVCDALIELPAPDVAALAEKAAIFAYEYDSCSVPHGVWRSIITDARRLMPETAIWPETSCEMEARQRADSTFGSRMADARADQRTGG